MKWLLLPLALGVSACDLPSEPLTEAAAELSGPLSTGEILQEVHAINVGEIQLAQLALQKSRNPEVQQTAQLIIPDHTALDQRVAAVAQAQGVQLDPSLLSAGTAAQAALIRDALAALSGPAFDREYLARNVELHEIALDTVRTDLLPSARALQVRELLMLAAPQLEQHLVQARSALGVVAGELGLGRRERPEDEEVRSGSTAEVGS